MPNMNGKGPMNAGQGTGRGLGPCGQGLRRGNQGGFGFNRFSRSAPNSKVSLEEEEKMLENELAAVRAEKESLQKEN